MTGLEVNSVESIILTACITLVGGVILLVIGELLKILVIIPIQKTREHIQIALSRVIFYSNRLTNYFPAKPSRREMDIIDSVTDDLRKTATNLMSNYTLVPMKRALSWIRVIPSQERIETAYQGLIYLHNSILFEGKRDYIENLIEINGNEIDRIQSALTNKKIPTRLKPIQRRKFQ